MMYIRSLFTSTLYLMIVNHIFPSRCTNQLPLILPGVRQRYKPIVPADTLLPTYSNRFCPHKRRSSEVRLRPQSPTSCEEHFGSCLQNDDCLIMMTLTFAYCFDTSVQQRHEYKRCDNMCAVALANLLNFNRSKFRGEDLLNCKDSTLNKPVWKTPWKVLYRICKKEVQAVNAALQISKSNEASTSDSICSVDCTLAAVACMSDRICRINILYALNYGCAGGRCSEHCARSLHQMHNKTMEHYQRVFTCYVATIDYSFLPCGDPYATRPQLQEDEKAMAYLNNHFNVFGRSTSVANFLPSSMLFVRNSRDIEYLRVLHSIMRDQACLPNHNFVTPTKPLCYLRDETSPKKALRSSEVTRSRQGNRDGIHTANQAIIGKGMRSKRAVFFSLLTCAIMAIYAP